MPGPTATIDRDQRDALYELVLNHLSAIGDLWIAVEDREFSKAEQLGIEFAEDLRLMHDLGWRETEGRGGVDLTMPLSVATCSGPGFDMGIPVNVATDERFDPSRPKVGDQLHRQREATMGRPRRGRAWSPHGATDGPSVQAGAIAASMRLLQDEEEKARERYRRAKSACEELLDRLDTRAR